MEYFGRNLFVMNILLTSMTRKPLIAGNLRPGNKGGDRLSRFSRR
jgi:hypothetical protein